MCGQIGYSSEKPFDIEKIKTLMVWNSLERGEDSTGLYSPKNGLKKSILKGSEFIVSNAKNYEILPDNIFMAHLRAKTIGAINVDNAHPFKRGNWVLQHNGTLTNHHDLIRKYELNYAEYDVDSDVICGALDKSGDILTVLSEIDGPAALIIQNITNPNRLYVFKNKERPLFKGTLDNSMYISSIENSLKLIGCNNVKEFKDNYLYTIENGLILKNSPREIKNKPYKHYYTQTNYVNDPQKYLGTVLKIPYDTFSHYNFIQGKNTNVKFDKDELVCVTKITANYVTLKKVFKPEIEGEFFLTTWENILNKYFINTACTCKLLYDIYLGDPENVIAKINDVVNVKQRIVNNAIDPVNLMMYDYLTGKRINYCDRSYLIKLMPNEITEYDINIMNNQIANGENSSELNSNEIINDYALTDNSVNQNEEIIPDDDTPVDDYYDDLDKHFSIMDQIIIKLKDLVYWYNDSQVLGLVNDLEDENFKAQNKFIYEDEEQT